MIMFVFCYFFLSFLVREGERERESLGLNNKKNANVSKIVDSIRAEEAIVNPDDIYRRSHRCHYVFSVVSE